jgi:hypothetical protein
MNMALQSTHVNNGNSNGSVPHMRGRGIRRRKLSRNQRAKLAADWASGRLQLELSLGQACELFNVPPAQVREELKARAEPERRALALIKAWRACSDSERGAAVHAIGVADVWDVIAKVVA